MPELILKNSKRQWMAMPKITKKTQFMTLFPDQPDKVAAISATMMRHPRIK